MERVEPPTISQYQSLIETHRHVWSRLLIGCAGAAGRQLQKLQNPSLFGYLWSFYSSAREDIYLLEKFKQECESTQSEFVIATNGVSYPNSTSEDMQYFLRYMQVTVPVRWRRSFLELPKEQRKAIANDDFSEFTTSIFSLIHLAGNKHESFISNSLSNLKCKTFQGLALENYPDEWATVLPEQS